jgi:hypothetical protein
MLSYIVFRQAYLEQSVFNVAKGTMTATLTLFCQGFQEY